MSNAATIVPDPDYPEMRLGSVEQIVGVWRIVFGTDPELDGYREFPAKRFASTDEAAEWLKVAAFSLERMD